MSDISDKDLDKMFREAAEGYETSFDESAWEDMERILDGDSDDGFGYFNILGGLIGLLLLGALVVWKIADAPADEVSSPGATENTQLAEQGANFESVSPIEDYEETSERSIKDKGVSNERLYLRAKGKENTAEAMSQDTNDPQMGNISASQSGGINSKGNDKGNLVTNQGQHSDGQNDVGITSVEGLNIQADNQERNISSQQAKMPIKTNEGGNAVLSGSTNEMSGHREDIQYAQDINLGHRQLEGEYDTLAVQSGQVLSLADDDQGGDLAISGGNISSVNDRLRDKEKEKMVTQNTLEVSSWELHDPELDVDRVQEGDDAQSVLTNRSNSLMEMDKADTVDDDDESNNGGNDGKLSVYASNDSNESTAQHEDAKRIGVFSPMWISRLGYPDYEYPQGDMDMQPVEMASSTYEEDVTEQVKSYRAFALKLTYSPDLTSVGYFNPDKAGSNFGLLGSYRFGRWRVESGAIYSRKIYFTEESNSSGYGSVVSEYNSIDGDCRVVDIPVNLSYHLTPNLRRGMYFSLGLSSYIMLSERYNFVTIDNGDRREWSKEVERENNHLFAMLNFSLGYEGQLTNRLSFQIEPFVKAPVKGVGDGEINLVSTGAFINLIYQFNRKLK